MDSMCPYAVHALLCLMMNCFHLTSEDIFCRQQALSLAMLTTVQLPLSLCRLLAGAAGAQPVLHPVLLVQVKVC